MYVSIYILVRYLAYWAQRCGWMRKGLLAPADHSSSYSIHHPPSESNLSKSLSLSSTIYYLLSHSIVESVCCSFSSFLFSSSTTTTSIISCFYFATTPPTPPPAPLLLFLLTQYLPLPFFQPQGPTGLPQRHPPSSFISPL